MRGRISWRLLFSVGWVVAAATLVPLLLGLWLDRRFALAPLCTLAGVTIGVIVSTTAAVQMVSRSFDRLGERRLTQSEQVADRKEEHA